MDLVLFIFKAFTTESYNTTPWVICYLSFLPCQLLAQNSQPQMLREDSKQGIQNS
jgi:hypothetical protein